MKKGLILIVGLSLLMSSCGTYEATGAYTGSQFGNMIGSAIGGISGGWRGHEIGSLIGTVGGAAAGAAIGAAADRSQQRKAEGRSAQRQKKYDNSGFDPQMRGNDRISFAGSTDNARLTIRNAGVYEDVRDGVLSRGEKCSVVFEIVNNSNHAVYDVYPLVKETTGNKHVKVSPNMRVESIAPKQAIRYTATLSADNRLKDGQIEVRIGVAQGNTVVDTETRTFTVRTTKRQVR